MRGATRALIRAAKVMGLVYALVAVVVLFVHVALLQMVTAELAIARAAAWPVWMAGGLRGAPLTND